ncbi:uncharacterized protein V1516DRAFT_679397 [Lipomyces oligophaga]|uniref:uncharacterized protein n=1 Tax=Lipomyces oligophaga TaxID=45792 RepID=UPI0034CF1FDA
MSKRTVLITGCSEGGIGAALAVAFHNAGLKVIATARNINKMTNLAALGIETMVLDVLSEESIQDAASKIKKLDILVNNAGAGYNQTTSDLDIAKAKELYDLNVWSAVRMIQVFLPLLLMSESSPTIVNQTSVLSVVGVPWQTAYGSSKAALASITSGLRYELAPFNINVIELKTALIASKFLEKPGVSESILPEKSIYAPAKSVLNPTLHYADLSSKGADPAQYAKEVVGDVLKKNPPKVIWRGEGATQLWLSTMLPERFINGAISKISHLNEVEKLIKQ